ncbi:MAG: hypothetical protein V8T00_02430 [Oscillospiraceae bacterium]
MNVLVPIGMRMKDVFEATGGFKEEPKMVLYGRTDDGHRRAQSRAADFKNTNAILAFGEAEATPPEPTACIKCGKCIAHCPLSLMPCEMETAYKKGNIERLMHLKVNLCMECGCCSFICPAHRPLVQTNKLAKAQVMAYKNALKAKAEAEKQSLRRKSRRRRQNESDCSGFAACHNEKLHSGHHAGRAHCAFAGGHCPGGVVFGLRAAGGCGYNGGLCLL